MQKTIAIASDHAGFKLKEAMKEYMKEQGIEVVDLGTDSEDSVDYPDFAGKMADFIAINKVMGIIVCGSGIGISIAANRHKHIRAALCRTEEDANLARSHNDANVLALGGRITDEQTALAILKVFLETEFEGGRHENRVNKLGEE